MLPKMSKHNSTVLSEDDFEEIFLQKPSDFDASQVEGDLLEFSDDEGTTVEVSQRHAEAVDGNNFVKRSLKACGALR